MQQAIDRLECLQMSFDQHQRFSSKCVPPPPPHVNASPASASLRGRERVCLRARGQAMMYVKHAFTRIILRPASAGKHTFTRVWCATSRQEQMLQTMQNHQAQLMLQASQAQSLYSSLGSDRSLVLPSATSSYASFNLVSRPHSTGTDLITYAPAANVASVAVATAPWSGPQDLGPKDKDKDDAVETRDWRAPSSHSPDLQDLEDPVSSILQHLSHFSDTNVALLNRRS
jgi:hypothetical protein